MHVRNRICDRSAHGRLLHAAGVATARAPWPQLDLTQQQPQWAGRKLEFRQFVPHPLFLGHATICMALSQPHLKPC